MERSPLVDYLLELRAKRSELDQLISQGASRNMISRWWNDYRAWRVVRRSKVADYLRATGVH